MKKVAMFLFFVLFFAVNSVYAQNLDTKRDIIDKLDLPMYNAMGKPDNYSITMRYKLEDECVDCIVSFFKEELAKRDWQVEKQEQFIDSYMDAYLKAKKQMAKRAGEGIRLSGNEEKLSKYVLSTDDKAIRAKIKKLAPKAIKAKNKFSDLNIYISVRLLPTNQTELTLTVYR